MDLLKDRMTFVRRYPGLVNRRMQSVMLLKQSVIVEL